MKKERIPKHTAEQELRAALKAFPHKRFADSPYITGGIAHLIARILFLSGVKTVRHCVGWLGGKKDLGHVMPHTFSVTVTPHIPSPDPKDPWGGYCLFYWLLRKAKINYSGGASESKGYAQACPQKSHEMTMRDIVVYFNSYQDNFKIV